MPGLLPINSWFVSDIPEARLAFERRTEEQEYQLQDVIFLEGQPAPEFYYILSGGCLLWKKTWEHRNEVITRQNWLSCSGFDSNLRAGDCFGGITCISGKPRATTAICSADKTRIIKISKEVFEEIGMQYPRLFLNVIRELSRRQATARDLEHILIHEGLEAHLVDYLLSLAREQDEPTSNPFVKFTGAKSVHLEISRAHLYKLVEKLTQMNILVPNRKQQVAPENTGVCFMPPP
jgi:CRP-like cAMP-binding protein